MYSPIEKHHATSAEQPPTHRAISSASPGGSAGAHCGTTRLGTIAMMNNTHTMKCDGAAIRRGIINASPTASATATP